MRLLVAPILAACLAAGPTGGGKGDRVAPDPDRLKRKNPDIAEVLKFAPKAPPLPKPTGPVVRVKTVKGLYDAVGSAKPGTTVLLADGVYKLPSEQLVIRTDRLALRGASGDREKVILDRGNRGRQSCVAVTGAHDVLIADLTCRNAKTHGVHIEPAADPAGTQRTRIYNVKFHNIATRMIKGSHPKYPKEPTAEHRADILRRRPVVGEIRYCLFLNDKRKTDRTDFAGGDYVGGIDMMWLKDWTIADNVFIGIRGRRGIGRGAIFIWIHSEDVVAERNIIINCDRGICFGNPSGSPVHMTRGIVRNNFIVVGASQGIEICRSVDTLVAHNTVVAAWPAHPSAVQFHQATKGARFVNNIVAGQVRMPDGVRDTGNILGDCTGWFVNPALGDLRLTAKADPRAGKARPLKKVPEDFDRRKRTAPASSGADQRD